LVQSKGRATISLRVLFLRRWRKEDIENEATKKKYEILSSLLRYFVFISSAGTIGAE